jgi:glycosyltransferase involved in cell wall biosynthesis
VHVIVNDGGEPGPLDALVNEYQDVYKGRLILLQNPRSLGMEAAANVGIRNSVSEFIVIHDDDDSWHPTFLQRCIDYLDDPPAVLTTPMRGVVTYSTLIMEELDGATARKVGTEPFNTWLNGISYYRMACNNIVPPISFVFSRAAMDEVGEFREDLPVLGDWDFHLRFIARFEIGLIQDELAYYHQRISINEGIYGNTTIAQDAKHRRYDHLLRNDLLRKDLENSQVGLGFLVNIAHSFEVLNNQLHYFSNLFHRLKVIRPLRWLYFKIMGR